MLSFTRKGKNCKFRCGVAVHCKTEFITRLVNMAVLHIMWCVCVCVCVSTQVTTLYLVQVSGLLSVWLLQFCNSMILGSLVLSFIVAALFVRHCQVSARLKTNLGVPSGRLH